MTEQKHPAAKNADQLAWAVWIGDDISHSDLFAVTADSEKEARERALDRSGHGEVVHVDGPYQDDEPGVWEFEFITEHRETVVVEAPNADYAEESADAERDYRGEYVQTIHAKSRRLNVEFGDRAGTEEESEK